MSLYIIIGFALFVFGVVLYAISVVIRRPAPTTDPHSDHCSLCGEKRPKEVLVERVLTNSTLIFLCPDCIRSLQRELRHAGVSGPLSKTARSVPRRKGRH